MDENNFEDMKYSELQKLAKSCGIRANMKVDKLVKSLRQYHNKSKDDINTSSTSTNSTSSEQEYGKENSPVNKKSKAKRGKGKKYVEIEVSTSEGKIKDEEETIKPAQKKRGRKKKSPVSLPRKSITGTPTLKSPLALKSPGVKKSTYLSVGSPAFRKSMTSTGKSPAPLRKSFTSVVKSPAGNSLAVKKIEQIQKRKRTVSGNRNSTCKIVSEEKSGEPTTKRQRNSSTSSATPKVTTPKQEKKKLSTSPGVKNMIQAMEGLSSEQMKVTLLEALDKKVKHDSPDKTSPSSTSQSTSNIPRFTAFLAKKNEEKKANGNTGTPDWKKIHKKEFQRWDSIDVYMEKKRQRAENLTGSLKKAQKLLKETQSAVDRLKNTKTPKISRGVNHDSARLSFQSPNVFKPKTVTTKNLNFQFGAKSVKNATPKTTVSCKATTPKPDTKPAKSPFTRTTPKPTNMKPMRSKTTPKPSAGLTNKTTISQKIAEKASQPTSANKLKTTTKTASPRKANSENSLTNSQISQKPTRKSFGDGLAKGVTPFTFQGALNTSINNSSMKKSLFNLKASLSKPLSWKPHTGKLKPLDLNTAYKSNNSLNKSSFKTQQTQTINDRRREVAVNRADKKFKAQMNKRGIIS